MIRNRYRRIVFFFGRLLFSLIVWDLVFPKIGLRNWAARTRSDRLRRSGQAFRLLAISMGGVLIKVGQFLSARVDVLPKEITDELAGLQDEVPAEYFEDVRRVAEAEFRAPLTSMYSQFEATPLAAASLGQVHRAVIQRRAESGGEPQVANVVVKIQRPNIESLIATDMAALETVGNWLQHYRPISRRADIPALLREFKRILYEEIDYLAEGRNAETFAENFSSDERIHVPQVIWTHTTKRVLTLENVWDIKITDYAAITKASIDRGEVASRLLDTYLKQIFEDGFFHADPHPGNLFIHPLRSSSSREGGQRDWKLVFVDFGMVGHVSPVIKDGLRELLMAVGTQDAHRLIQAYDMLGVLLPDADTELLERASAEAFDRFWGKNMSELQQVSLSEMRQFAEEFRELLYALPFQVPQDFIFLVRAVGILSGMCTGLDPQFNVWQHIAPYTQKIVAEEVRTGRDYWLEEIRNFGRTVFALPYRLDSLFSRIERGDINLRTPEVSQQISRIEASIRQVLAGIIFIGFLISGVQFYLANYLGLGITFLVGAGVSLLWIVLTLSRR
ncbi:MAG: hypothetical protein A2W33_08700 [Chloroflexi bacterium RBG_16_52_11]|nr:MAG: hypothetical protein A2W33_08700 [Chloroflexi bacterium RBG_16_52_11]